MEMDIWDYVGILATIPLLLAMALGCFYFCVVIGKAIVGEIKNG